MSFTTIHVYIPSQRQLTVTYEMRWRLPWIVIQLPILKMENRKNLCARKATWLAFGLIALAAVSSAQNAESYNSISTPSPSFVSNSSSLISEDRRLLIRWLNSLQTTDATSPSSVPSVAENAITSKPLSVSRRNYVFWYPRTHNWDRKHPYHNKSWNK